MDDKSNPEDFGYLLNFTIEPNLLVSNCMKNLEAFRELYSQVPNRYGWRQISVSAFTANYSKADSDLSANSIYWLDVARSLEAYNTLVLWRGGELLLSAEQCLQHASAVIPLAVLSRSLIELTTSFIVNGGLLRRYIANISFEKKEHTRLLSQGVEDVLNKALFGTRLVGKKMPGEQTNILTHIENLTKISGYEPLADRYKRLCDVTHPNVLGNARFWSNKVQPYPDGSELRVLERDDVSNDLCILILDDAIWGMSWSAANIRSGFQILGEQSKVLSAEFPATRGLPN